MTHMHGDKVCGSVLKYNTANGRQGLAPKKRWFQLTPIQKWPTNGDFFFLTIVMNYVLKMLLSGIENWFEVHHTTDECVVNYPSKFE